MTPKFHSNSNLKKKLPEASETFKLKPWGQPDSKVNQRSAFI